MTEKPAPANTRTNRMRGLELAVQYSNPGGETVESILTKAEAFSNYLHTGTITKDAPVPGWPA